MVSHENDDDDAARATLGGVLRARAATRAAYLGNEAPHLDGLVSLELLRARDFTAKHFAALPLACPALRRLRLVACANCRGTLASDTQLPPPVASSDRRLSATSDGHFGEMTPVEICVEIKFYGAFVLNRRVVLHAIDAMHPTH